ncbi:WG repeat-containing protein [Paenibacillus sp. FSL R7-0204]|uniref:WG repeat-containing protein n=1 Tax=Paenibacillus TaxID=44249 RepID=UPI00096C2C2B|nr:WG repeat-containing protein [Paenibacillus odorifer]OME19947.1 hypothetical protein BSK57_23550 [Paenibacillus odorifer]
MRHAYAKIDGTILHEGRYINADRFYEDFALLITEQGFSHMNMDFLTPYPIYKWLTRYFHGWAAFESLDGTKGFIDYSHQNSIYLDFDGFARFSSDGVASYSKNGLSGIIDQSGNIILDPTYTRVDVFSEGFALVEIDSNFGFLNTKGEVTHPAVWNNALFFKNGLAAVSNSNNKWGCVNTNGDLVIPTKYSFLGACDDERICFQKGRKYGFLNMEGEIVIPPIFEEVDGFSEGYAAVQVNKKWGIIDTKGDFIVEPALEMARRFYHGCSIIVKDNTVGLLSPNGEMTMYPQFHYVDYPYKDIMSVVLE